MMRQPTKEFWDQRYIEQSTGWDLGVVSTPIKSYIDQLEIKDISILIPGAGNGYEAEYLYNKGFKNVYVLDISSEAIKSFKNRVPKFPDSQIINQDFFKLQKTFDLIIEQTFFCAIDKNLRSPYVQKAFELLNNQGKIAGLLFDAPLYKDHPPFGGNIEEYKMHFETHFDIKIMEKAYNSMGSRNDKELWVKMIKKERHKKSQLDS